MDQKNLPLFIALSLAILLGFQYFAPHRPVRPPSAPPAAVAHAALNSPVAAPTAAGQPSAEALAKAPRLVIDGPRVSGSLNLLGARFDDLRLKDYHDTVSPNSPLVRVLQPADAPQPGYVQFGWTGPDGVKMPDNLTLWTSSGGNLAAGHPVTLSWDNGAGLQFAITLSVDANYMFAVTQSVHNSGNSQVALLPWSRVHRDFEPKSAGLNVFEGLLGVMDGTLHSDAYSAIKSEAAKHEGVGYEHLGQGGWAGFTDEYWLTAIIPDQALVTKTEWTHVLDEGVHRYQVSFVPQESQVVKPGDTAVLHSAVFAGAKEVRLLDRYEASQHIPLLSYAVDWGWFFFLTKPFFYALDALNSFAGNFGVAILLFTLGIKLLFYPIAARSYRQMGKMRLLGPKITAVREQYKDDPAKLQSEMMAVYKAENVSPVSGCAPMLLQIPVFFSLYKVILISIEMRHAPFFGWIRDLSAIDPTNIFNLFGLIPIDPDILSPYLHLGIWPLIMGATMYVQQRLNPPPPDPAQAKMMQFMPLIFMFTMGRFPAGLVIYWSWNNTLTFVQQWYIQRQAELSPKKK